MKRQHHSLNYFKMPYLRTDHYSSYNTSKLYGRAGEPVEILSDHGGTLIVETKAGLKIPLNRKDISDKWPAEDDYVPPPPPAKNTVPAKKQARKSATTPNTQRDLF